MVFPFARWFLSIFYLKPFVAEFRPSLDSSAAHTETIHSVPTASPVRKKWKMKVVIYFFAPVRAPGRKEPHYHLLCCFSGDTVPSAGSLPGSGWAQTEGTSAQPSWLRKLDLRMVLVHLDGLICSPAYGWGADDVTDRIRQQHWVACPNTDFVNCHNPVGFLVVSLLCFSFVPRYTIDLYSSLILSPFWNFGVWFDKFL